MDKWKTMSFAVIGLTLLMNSATGAAADATDGAAVGGTTLASAIVDPRRPAAQVRLDATRKPGAILAFAGVHSGAVIVDFMPGNAYFTRLFSAVVGKRGRVVAFIPAEEVANCSPDEIAGTRALGGEVGYTNVTVLTAPLADFPTADKLDVIFTAQNYHDLHDTFMGPADVATLNKRFFDALQPGGLLIVIDHVAEPGSGLRDTETLHRIDPQRLRLEVEAAGFIFDARSDVLRNPEDDHRRSVFDPAIRGRTDQIVFRFRKAR